MKLNERIKDCRQRSGLTQEQVAEALGVSRQAVTKWENGQSAPSTEKLFKLAELFGTTVDLILSDEADQKLSAAEEFYLLYQADQQRQLEAHRSRSRCNLRLLLLTAVWYLLIFLIGRILNGNNLEIVTIADWLFNTNPRQSSYLFGWLLGNNRYLLSSVVSMFLAIIGVRKVSISLSVSFLIGLLAGELFGPNPQGQAMGFGHYGWFYWTVFMLMGLAVGLVWEFIGSRKKLRKNSENST